MTASTTTAPVVGRPAPDRIEALSGIDRPTRRDEAWRYAPHAELAQLRFGPASAHQPAVPAGVLEQIPVVDGPRVVVVNGVFRPELSDLSALPGGVQVSSLARAAEERPDLVAAHFGQDSAELADAFVALNVAFGTDGVAIQVDDGRRTDAPLHLVHIVTSERDRDTAAPNAWCSGVVIRARRRCGRHRRRDPHR